MKDLLNQLDNIFEVLRLAKKLTAPITDIELAENCENLPLALPDYVINLYRWHNGIEELIPGFTLLSLQDAISLYKALIEYAQEIEEEFEDCEFYKNTYFPILQSQDLFFVIDCNPSSNGNIYIVDGEDFDEAIKEYENLEQMFQVIVDAYLSQAYYIEDDFLDDNPVLFQKVKNKHLSEAQYIKKEENWKNISHQAISCLKSQDPQRKYFITTLYESYDERAIPYLHKFLKDSDSEVVSNAVFGLGELRSRESLSELVKLLKHPVEKIRTASASAISNIINPQDKLLLQPLLDSLADDSTSVRISAVNALGCLRNSAAVSPLILLLKNKSYGLRISAAEALGKIADNASLEALKIRKNQGIKGLELEVIERIINRLEKSNS